MIAVQEGGVDDGIKAALILSVLSHCHTVTRVKRNRPSKKEKKMYISRLFKVKYASKYPSEVYHQ